MKPLLFALLATTLSAAPLPLREAAAGRFLVGVALNEGLIRQEDPAAVAQVVRHFDSVTAENAMKWEKIQPELGRFDFALADQLMAFAEQHHLAVIGHTLVWHEQTPAWVFQDEHGQDLSPEQLAERLRTHIRTVMGRYKGRILGWDVVNEAIGDDGKLRTDKPWYRILGLDALRIAFRTAHEVDPAAELYYNDYSVWNEPKCSAILALLQQLRSEGIPIHAVGLQEHYLLNSPSLSEIDACFTRFTAAGFPLVVTELDVSLLPRPEGYVGADIRTRFAQDPKFNPFPNGLSPEMEAAFHARYLGLFRLYKKHSAALQRVTVWGLSDRSSWLNHWPIPGRTDYPLLFDRQAQPKPVVHAISEMLQSNAP